MAAPAILTALELDKSFGPRSILRGVSLTLHEGDRVGLVGINGCGKSTLMRLLVGVAADGGPASDVDGPDGGTITRKRGLRLEYVPQEPRLDGDATVGAVLREGLAARAGHGGDPAELEYELRGLSASLALPATTALVGQLSLGERRRVALGRALLTQADLLALDEPTNHLDGATVAWLEQRLASAATTLLLVTHDRYFLDRVATRIVELDRGELFGYEGNYSYFIERQAERLAIEDKTERARASFVRRELDWIRRGPAARSTKQQARIDRFDAAVAARPDADAQRSGPLSLRLPHGPRLGKSILELRGVSRRTDERALFEGLDLVLKAGDRIGIVGPNGAGKTTLIRVMLGELAPDSGEVVRGQNTHFAFLDQGRSALADERTVLEEVAGDSDHVLLPDGPIHVRSFLRMMLFPDAVADTRIGALSGGERNRVELARLLRLGGNVIVLDEPTNDLDLVTLGVLEDALCEFPGCALIVSHDRWFLDRVATGILAFEGDGQVTFYEGSYSSYLARPRGARNVAATDASQPSTGAGRSRRDSRSKAQAPRKLSFKERHELAGIEAAITAAEGAVAELEASLEDPALYRERAAEVPAMVARLDRARAEVEQLFARWQELEAVAADG